MEAVFKVTKKIESLYDLDSAVREKQSVFCPSSETLTQKPVPASAVMRKQGVEILALIENGLYIYRKPEKGTSNENQAKRIINQEF